MTTVADYRAMDWWAEGDTPVHDDSSVIFFTDGRMTMREMCLYFLKARRSIHLANWGITPGIELVRGRDQRAGDDGSPEQERLVASLREEGLDEDAIHFWYTQRLTLLAVLCYAKSKGVDVRMLPWDCPPIFEHYDPKAVGKELTENGITCLLDDSSRHLLHHLAESLHQKITIVDGTVAFVGGIDPLIEKEGDYDRWDTSAHEFASRLRETTPEKPPHPWHDAHAKIEGPAAADVELNFRQRWNEVVEHKKLDKKLLLPAEEPLPPVPPEQRTGLVQIARTIPKTTYDFAQPDGIQGIAGLYAKALDNTQQFIYLENQYFWLRAYSGLDFSMVGFDSPQMERNIRELGESLRRGAFMAIALPDHPNVGRAFTDTGLTRLHDEAPEAVEEGRLHAFTLGTWEQRADGIHYRPVYVHAKVAIIDDIWATVGSGNLNNRGMRDDVEMNVAALDPRQAYRLRLLLWAEHLGLLNDDDLFEVTYYYKHQQKNSRGEQIWQKLTQTIGNPRVGLDMMARQAWDNLRRFQQKQPLVGHLLPYLRADEARQQGINFREDEGWLEETG